MAVVRPRNLVVVPLVALGLLAAACGGSSGASAATSSSGRANWPKTLVLGEVGEDNATSLTQSFAPVAALIKKQLGVTIQSTAGTSYASMIEAQKAGKAQIIGYGPFSYVIALNQGLKIQDIGIVLAAPNTDGGYWSEAVVDPQHTPSITSIKDFAGKKVCFSDPSSTSGYLYPSYGLLTNGINPSTGVTAVFAGSDSTTALDTYQGSCQVGFTNTFSLPQVYSANHVPQTDLKIVWKGPEIPGNPMAISDSVPASLRNALEKLLVNEANSSYLTAHGYCKSVSACTALTGGWGYGPPSDANFSQITKICQITNSPSCKIS